MNIRFAFAKHNLHISRKPARRLPLLLRAFAFCLLTALLFGCSPAVAPPNGSPAVSAAPSAAVSTLTVPQESAEVRVLMYHNIIESGQSGSAGITAADFRREMQALRDDGYNTVSTAELIDYVYAGGTLPENAVLLRFDDGYSSNYELAFPILKEFGYKATIFVVGVSVGHSTYKDTDTPITPHFTFEQAAEMTASGLIEIQSHTYDMHQERFVDGEDCRRGMLQMQDEGEADYIAALRADFERSRAELEAAIGQRVAALAYPHGLYSDLTEAMLVSMGVRVTLTTDSGVNTVVKGVPQSLLGLKVWSLDNAQQ